MIRDPTGRYALPAQDTTALEHSRSLQLSPRNLSVANWMDGLRSSSSSSSSSSLSSSKKPSQRRSAPSATRSSHSNAESIHRQNQTSQRQQRVTETSPSNAAAATTRTTKAEAEYDDAGDDDTDDPGAWEVLADALAQHSTYQYGSGLSVEESAVEGSAATSTSRAADADALSQKASENLEYNNEAAETTTATSPLLSPSRFGLLRSSASTSAAAAAAAGAGGAGGGGGGGGGGEGGSLAGQTPLHVAARAGNLQVVSSLIRAKVDVNFPAVFSGSTALHDACDVDEPGIVAALVHAKASLTVQTDREGWTPLHHACASGSVDSVKVLILAKADPNAASFRGDQPLDVAEKRRNVYLVNYLYSVGARESTEAGFPFSPHSRASAARLSRTAEGNFNHWQQQEEEEQEEEEEEQQQQQQQQQQRWQSSTAAHRRSFSGSSAIDNDIVTNLNRSAFAEASASSQHTHPRDDSAGYSPGRASDSSNDERADQVVVGRLRDENKRLQALVESQQAEIASLRAELGMRGGGHGRGRSSLSSSSSSSSSSLSSSSAPTSSRSSQLQNRAVPPSSWRSSQKKGDSGSSRSLSATRPQQSQSVRRGGSKAPGVHPHVVRGQSILPPWLQGITPNELDPRWTSLSSQQQSMIHRALGTTRSKRLERDDTSRSSSKFFILGGVGGLPLEPTRPLPLSLSSPTTSQSSGARAQRGGPPDRVTDDAEQDDSIRHDESRRQDGGSQRQLELRRALSKLEKEPDAPTGWRV